MTPNPYINDPKTIVLLDPTSADGEDALDLLGSDDTHVTLLLPLSGRSSAALREFAACENISVSNAGWIYLEQVAGRTAHPGRLIENVTSSGPDPASDIADLVAENSVRRVLIPGSLARTDPTAYDELRVLVPMTQVASRTVSAS